MLARLVHRLTRKLAVRLAILLQGVDGDVARATLPRFGNTPKNVTILLPREIRNPERIYLGDDVKLGSGSVLKATTEFPGSWLKHPDGQHVHQRFEPVIRIGARVTATASLHIAAVSEVRIGDDVMFASNVFVSDGSHRYDDARVPYKYQGLSRIAPVVIERGCWVGQNVVILPGVTIGELSIIAANSVVTRSVPARCIAAGAPARVVKQWDDASEKWTTP